MRSYSRLENWENWPASYWNNNRAGAKANALYTDETADSTEYAALTATLALLDQNYALAESASLSNMADTLAADEATESPWASYYAAQMSAYDDWTQATAATQETHRVAAARGQAGVDAEGNPTGGGEAALYDAERDLSIAAANADYEQATALITAAHEVNTANAASSSALGSAGAFGTTYPEIERASPGEYVVEAIPGSAGAGLGASFWDLAGELEAIQFGTQVHALGGLSSQILRLVAPSIGDQAQWNPDSSLVEHIRPALQSKDETILDILHSVSSTLGEFWQAVGHVVHVAFPERPAIESAPPLSAATYGTTDQRGDAHSSISSESPAPKVFIEIPSEWSSAQAAKLIADGASGAATGGSLDTLREEFLDFAGRSEANVGEASVNQPQESATSGYESTPPIEVKLAQLNPNDLPFERVRQLVKEGKAIEILHYVGWTPILAIGVPLKLASGVTRSLIIEWVPAGWFTPGRYRIVGVGPDLSHYSLKRAMDTMVFSPADTAGDQSAADMAEFVLHVIPLGGAADNLSQGNLGEAALSLAGDAAMLLTGGATKAIAATKAAQAAGVTEKGLKAAGIVTEVSIAGIRGIQGGLKLYDGTGGFGEIGEAILRLFGVSIIASGTRAARTAGEVIDDVNARAHLKVLEHVADAPAVTIGAKSWQEYELAIRKLYGSASFSRRQFTAIVDGQVVNGIADNVTEIAGKRVAVEAKFVENWRVPVQHEMEFPV